MRNACVQRWQLPHCGTRAHLARRARRALPLALLALSQFCAHRIRTIQRPDLRPAARFQPAMASTGWRAVGSDDYRAVRCTGSVSGGAKFSLPGVEDLSDFLCAAVRRAAIRPRAAAFRSVLVPACWRGTVSLAAVAGFVAALFARLIAPRTARALQAPNAGPIALTPATGLARLTALRASGVSAPGSLTIFSACGAPLASTTLVRAGGRRRILSARAADFLHAATPCRLRSPLPPRTGAAARWWPRAGAALDGRRCVRAPAQRDASFSSLRRLRPHRAPCGLFLPRLRPCANLCRS